MQVVYAFCTNYTPSLSIVGLVTKSLNLTGKCSPISRYPQHQHNYPWFQWGRSEVVIIYPEFIGILWGSIHPPWPRKSPTSMRPTHQTQPTKEIQQKMTETFGGYCSNHGLWCVYDVFMMCLWCVYDVFMMFFMIYLWWLNAQAGKSM